MLLKALFTVVLFAIDVMLALFAIWLFMKIGAIIAIVATILWMVGLPTGWIAIGAAIFTIGKWIWVWISASRN